MWPLLKPRLSDQAFSSDIVFVCISGKVKKIARSKQSFQKSFYVWCSKENKEILGRYTRPVLLNTVSPVIFHCLRKRTSRWTSKNKYWRPPKRLQQQLLHWWNLHQPLRESWWQLEGWVVLNSLVLRARLFYEGKIWRLFRGRLDNLRLNWSTRMC